MTDLFECARLSETELRDTVTSAEGDCGAITDDRHAIPHRFGSLPTAGLWLVDVEHGTRNRTSFFVKLLRHPRACHRTYARCPKNIGPL